MFSSFLDGVFDLSFSFALSFLITRPFPHFLKISFFLSFYRSAMFVYIVLPYTKAIQLRKMIAYDTVGRAFESCSVQRLLRVAVSGCAGAEYMLL